MIYLSIERERDTHTHTKRKSTYENRQLPAARNIYEDEIYIESIHDISVNPRVKWRGLTAFARRN